MALRPSFTILACAALFISACGGTSSTTTPKASAPVVAQCNNTENYSEENPPPIEHVFVVVLENKSFDEIYGPGSPAVYLRETLVPSGQLLTHFYGTSHASTGNYISMIGGQAPNAASHGDCAVFAQWTEFNPLQPVLEYGQANGVGCVYPERFPTLVDELELNNAINGSQYTWRGWMEDMALEQSGQVRAQGRPADNSCTGPALNDIDGTNGSDTTEQYAARHNPFLFYRSILGNAETADDFARCDRNVVDLQVGSAIQGVAGLQTALLKRNTTPNYNLIVPDNCHNGHDSGQQCTDTSGGPGGLAEADQFLQTWIPRIMNSPAYKEAGMIVILFDESNFGTGGAEDYDGCCGMELDGGLKHRGADTGLNGLLGPGGGRFGAVVLSPFTKANTENSTPYNHYSFLRTLENLFGLDKVHIDPNTPDTEAAVQAKTAGYIGYAGLPTEEGMHAFGSDVYNCQK
ncbi:MULTISPECIES: alkaline phosphatase family protein [Zhongshania]|jgi:hypothetical protein|uniref:Phosphoesterase n=1 Tax=Zhongshania antarctica TaxID=641702 RepID=A0A840R3H1_9GAMM|nr:MULTISPECIES: alkaline phosphatase family protein [Zhongshania]MBB5187675.1 hypothetical protein [Zhongshania antarctica]